MLMMKSNQDQNTFITQLKNTKTTFLNPLQENLLSVYLIEEATIFFY